MSLPIGTALKDGFFKVASRTGAILIAAYLVVNGVYLVAMNSTMQAYFTENAPEAQDTMAAQNAFPMAVDLPLAVGAALSVLCIVLMMYVVMIAMRTFVVDARDTFQGVDLTGGIAFAIVNLIVGGIVQGILVFVGLIALVVPGIFLAISLAFMQLFIVVEGDNFVAAMRRSWRLTEGNRVAMFALGAVVVGLSLGVGLIVGIGALIGTLAGLDQAIINVLQIIVTIPVSLYSIAVLASAYNLLRGDTSGIDGGESSTTDTPSTPA